MIGAPLTQRRPLREPTVRIVREIAGLGMFCLMRVAKKVRVMMEDGEVSPFDELSDAPGTSWRRRARAFKKSGWTER